MNSPQNPFLKDVPEALHELMANYIEDWHDSCARDGVDPAVLPSGIKIDRAELGRTWASSDFVARNCIRFPNMLYGLLDEGMHSARSLQDYRELVEAAIDAGRDNDGAIDEPLLMKSLRVLRRKEMTRIAWRDLNGLDDVLVILQELTDCAEAFVAVTLQALEDNHAERYGMPLDADGEAQRLLTFAMGKMGGGELNFSSDIDLIFVFPEDGETTGRSKTSHYEFYTVVVRKLVKMLDEVTADGFVYRVDTRLRPFGQSGPVAMSFPGIEQYYQLHGRDWERYAMIKARLVTGRQKDRRYLQSLLTPFVYRRYLDFSMIESIRDMKSMINTQMQRKGMHDNIKLGPGGIREIEFIGQTLQLIRAGRDPELRERGIIRVLGLLADKHFLKQHEVEGLVRAYGFLRRLENRLQMLSDKQTHKLPEDALSRQRICLAMGMPDWQSLLDVLGSHQAAVDAVFHNLIAAEDESSPDEASAFALYWGDASKNFTSGEVAQQALRQYLEGLGYTDPDSIIVRLDDLHSSSAIKHLSGDSVKLMAQLVESLLEKIADYPGQPELLDRAGRILKALAGRKVYISLLSEYPAIQVQMLTLCAVSEWFTERLTRYPILLDSLLTSAESFRHDYDVRQLLELELGRIETDVDTPDDNPDANLEQLMERMRQFKRQMVFTVAMLDVFYQEPVEKVSDHLTELADVLLEKILDYSWRAMVRKYGEPQYLVDGEVRVASMAIIAYGKMGGNELGYGSDLDIIFVHDSRGDEQHTSGEKTVENQQFFARVAQRVIHFLNTRTYSGILYEADTRLRPDGQAGLMVSSISAFEQYQRDKAWTWEHQALIRARFVTEISHSDIDKGSEPLRQEFDRIRSSVLRTSRERDVLLRDVVDMREKMREHLSGKSEHFDLKQDRGGLVDIEFATQAGVLLHAVDCADCIRHTATLELINELVGVGWYSQQEADALSSAYRSFRKLKNWQKLSCDASAVATVDEIEGHRDRVIAVWDRLMPGPVKQAQ